MNKKEEWDLYTAGDSVLWLESEDLDNLGYDVTNMTRKEFYAILDRLRDYYYNGFGDIVGEMAEDILPKKGK